MCRAQSETLLTGIIIGGRHNGIWLQWSGEEGTALAHPNDLGFLIDNGR